MPKVETEPRQMVFSINALNKVFQKNTSPVEIDYSRILDVQFGKVLLFFKSVDVHLDNGQSTRFRGMGRKNANLLAYLREKKIQLAKTPTS